MKIEFALSSLSLLVSIVAVLVAIYTLKRTEKASKMPVLVFVRRSGVAWQIHNVGQGPAVWVAIGNKEPEKKWFVVLFDPIASGAIIDLPWSQPSIELGAKYTDVNGNIYSSLLKMHANYFYEKDKFPHWEPHITEQRINEIRKELTL